MCNFARLQIFGNCSHLQGVRHRQADNTRTQCVFSHHRENGSSKNNTITHELQVHSQPPAMEQTNTYSIRSTDPTGLLLQRGLNKSDVNNCDVFKERALKNSSPLIWLVCTRSLWLFLFVKLVSRVTNKCQPMLSEGHFVIPYCYHGIS